MPALRLLPSLARLAPPARVIDKRVYSPWTEGHFDRLLAGGEVDTLGVTRGETDVCVLATALARSTGNPGPSSIIATDATLRVSVQSADGSDCADLIREPARFRWP